MTDESAAETGKEREYSVTLVPCCAPFDSCCRCSCGLELLAEDFSDGGVAVGHLSAG